MPGFDVISEIFGQFAPVEQIDTERQIAFVESQVGDLLKAEAGGAGSDQFLEAVPGGAGDETGIDRGEPLWQNC